MSVDKGSSKKINLMNINGYENLSKEQKSDLLNFQNQFFVMENYIEKLNEYIENLSNGHLINESEDKYDFKEADKLRDNLIDLSEKFKSISKGDYSQSTNFKYEINNYFDDMITHLIVNKFKFETQSSMLSKNMELMRYILSGIDDWIIIITKETNEVIYVNDKAKLEFYNPEEKIFLYEEDEILFNILMNKNYIYDENSSFTYKYETTGKYLSIKSFFITWEETPAYIYYMANVTAEKETEVYAFKDALTNLYNRRYFMLTLEHLINTKTDFSLCMIDLDGLKYVNDNLGHNEGDNYINTVADELRKITRSSDVISRIGGDEMSILFTKCEENIVLDKMKDFDKALETLSTEYKMGASYGVIRVKEDNRLSKEEIIQLADDKMYELKRQRKQKR